MVNIEEMCIALEKAREFVFEGCNQILTGCLDENHGISASPGATALATLALLVLGRNFEISHKKGSLWLWRNRQTEGWGKHPGDNPDMEVSRLVQTVIHGSQGGWLGRFFLISQARHFSELILNLSERAVPGLEGPEVDEIAMPNILKKEVLNKLPPYGRSVVIAAAMLAAKGQEGISQGLLFLRDTQMTDGSWAEDTVATSMAVLALQRFQAYPDRAKKAGYWLMRKQYSSGAWPAFDQLHTWSMGWAVNILGSRNPEESNWLERATDWLKKGRNADGSYGSTPPNTHPDLDDTAVALMGLPQSSESEETVQLLKRLQNEDGSWGTFPDFEGKAPNLESKLPVYITSADVTIHVLEALWRHRVSSQEITVQHGLNWLLTQQKTDGEVDSIWYDGPIYATAQMAELLSKWKFNWKDWEQSQQIMTAQNKALDYLLAVQNEDGSWGETVVETALALSALWRKDDVPQVVYRGVEWILARQRKDGSFNPSYNGIYAKGWNYEEPIATALTAIRALERIILK